MDIKDMGLAERIHAGGPIEFSPARKQALDNQCSTLLQRTMEAYEAYQFDNDTSWRLIRRRSALGVYKKKLPTAENSSTFMCTGFIGGRFDEIPLGMITSSNDELETHHSVMGSNYIDATLVAKVEQDSFDSPLFFSMVRWLVFKLGFSDRQTMTYERGGRTYDSHGQELIYHVLTSIDLLELPRSLHLDLQYSDVRMCYLFRHLRENTIGVFLLSDVQLPDSFGKSFMEYISAAYIMNVDSYVIIARARAYSALVAATATKESSVSSKCDICLALPSFIRGELKNCSGCLRNVCRKCRLNRMVFRRRTNIRKCETERFCKRCVAIVEHPKDFSHVHEFRGYTQEESSSATMSSQGYEPGASFSSSEQRMNSLNSMSNASIVTAHASEPRQSEVSYVDTEQELRKLLANLRGVQSIGSVDDMAGSMQSLNMGEEKKE